jgi:hypothetical protein
MKGEERMKARTLLLGALSVALLGALPGWAQDIPAGDDAWDSLGGGATEVTLSSADWKALCGATVPDTVVELVGYNIPGLGTADTVVTRLDNAAFGTGNTATVKIQLKTLSFVNDGSHPCSPLTIRVTQDSTQSTGTMTITRTSSAGGTFTAQVPVNAVIQAIDGSGAVKGTTYVSGVLSDDSTAPWSYSTTGIAATRNRVKAAATSSWKPGVDPVTKQPVRICRRGNKILPARHCYQPPPPCPIVKSPAPAGAATTKLALATETCTVSTTTPPASTN